MGRGRNSSAILEDCYEPLEARDERRRDEGKDVADRNGIFIW